MQWNVVKKISPRITYIFLRWMRWITYFHRVLSTLTKKETYLHGFVRISYINFPQKLMRWIFVRNAVKCFFTAFTSFTAFFTKIHSKTSTRVTIKSEDYTPYVRLMSVCVIRINFVLDGLVPLLRNPNPSELVFFVQIDLRNRHVFIAALFVTKYL